MKKEEEKKKTSSSKKRYVHWKVLVLDIVRNFELMAAPFF